jgi:hypothetical protein
MTRKIYKTAMGKSVDLGALQLQNESVRAVGNMSVNARGDLIDAWNRPIDSRNQQVSKQYNKQVSNVESGPVQYRQKAAAAAVVDIPAPPEDFEDDFVKETDGAPSGTAIPEGGLASALAKARQIKQEPLPTAKELVKNRTGVNRV